MNALGLIETKGTIASIESADAMLKSANVTLIDKSKVGSGIMTVSVVGDVASVKAAVDAGASAVRALDPSLLISTHVIPRPDKSIENIMYPKYIVESKEIESAETESTQSLIHLNKKIIDEMVKEIGIEAIIQKLKDIKVVKLRNIAREYKNFGIAGRKISTADKKVLLEEIKNYYNK